jgi:alanine racemase
VWYALEFAAWSEIDVNALKRNVRRTQQIVGPRVDILLTVKADGYGHGAPHVAKAAIAAGVQMLGVATLHEGMELRNAALRGPILILSPSLPAEIDEILEYDLTPTVSDMEFARDLATRASQASRTARVHVDIDTGMTRGGVNEEDACDFLSALAKLKGLSVEGVYTHFPSTYHEDGEFSEHQLGSFTKIIDTLGKQGLVFRLRHAANSAAVAQYPESHINMVRPGGMVYGMFPRKDMNGLGFEPVMSFKSRVVNVKHVRKGKTVSYGRTYRFDHDAKVAAVAAGYGHGISRLLSNNGDLLVRGVRAPIVGMITMDVTMIDVSHIPQVNVGDEVIIFGKQGDEEISVYDVARRCGTISYEITCGIGKRVPRVYVENGTVTGIVTLVGEWLSKQGISL